MVIVRLDGMLGVVGRQAEGDMQKQQAPSREGERMIRKDIALDADRPHYYSQFWIDVAAGKREIGAPLPAAPEHELEHELMDMVEAAATTEFEPDGAELEPEVPVAKPVRPAKAKAEPKRAEPARSALTSLADLAKIDLMMKSSAEMGDETVPDIEHAATAPMDEEAIVTDFDPNAVPFEEPEEPVAEEELAEEHFDEEDDWGEEEGPRRGSKPAKRQRREPRREF